MNKASVYILLILVFLGLSKSFSPSEHQTPYLANESVFPHYFIGAPLSVMLIDSFQTGFIIKTYFQRYKLIHGFAGPEYITVRTGQDFWQENLKNLGMSLFRRSEGDDLGSTTPAPPGTLFIGDPAYGTWVYEKSGNRIWKFHRAYRHFPEIFHWGDFRPTDEFHEQLEIHLNNQQPFYGLTKEFGDDGKVTSQSFSNTLNYHQRESPLLLREHLRRQFSLPAWKISNVDSNAR